MTHNNRVIPYHYDYVSDYNIHSSMNESSNILTESLFTMHIIGRKEVLVYIYISIMLNLYFELHSSTNLVIKLRHDLWFMLT